MSYDSSRFRGDAAYSDEPGRADDGFRDSPAFRDSVAYRELAAQSGPAYREDETTTRGAAYAPGAYPAGGYPGGDYAGRDYGTDRTMGLSDGEPQTSHYPAPPVPARPPRDRLGAHFGWELLLALATAGVAVLLYRTAPDALRGANLEALYISAAVLGFVAVGMALSLRAGAPNLALGPLTYAGAMFFADNSDRGLLVTAGVTGLLAIAVGIAIAVVVTALHVPAWAASLGAGLGLIVWIQLQRNAAEVVNGAYRPTDHALIWFGGFVALSLLGGAAGLASGVRNAVGQFRPAGDPSRRGGGAVSAAVALIGSSALAAASGVLLALYNREISPNENGIALTGLALGAALLGGTSVFGRRGGLFGTVLAVVLFTLVVRYADAEGWIVNNLGLAAAAIGVGLLVSRVMEALGGGRRYERPPGPGDPEVAPMPAEDWAPASQGAGAPNPWGTPSAGRPPDDRWDDRWASR